MGSQMMNTTLPVYVMSIGCSNIQAGLVGGVLPITALLLRPLVRWVTDVWKRRSIAVIGNSFYGIASIVYALSNSIGTLVLGRVVHGVGISSYTTTANAYNVDIAPNKRRAEALGLFAVTTSLGLIIGPTVGFHIVSLFNLHWL
jgi:MFS family permease